MRQTIQSKSHDKKFPENKRERRELECFLVEDTLLGREVLYCILKVEGTIMWEPKEMSKRNK